MPSPFRSVRRPLPRSYTPTRAGSHPPTHPHRPPALARAQSAEQVRIKFEDGSEVELQGSRGRITVVCMADSLNNKHLQEQARLSFPHSTFTHYPQVLHQMYADSVGMYRGDVFYFDYGVVVLWGFASPDVEKSILTVVDQVTLDPLESAEVQVDEFEFVYSHEERPKIQNDVVTLHHAMAGDAMVRQSIAHALAQSTKLCVFEERVAMLAEETKTLPEQLASTGHVKLGRKVINRLIGEVFIHRSAVNLLSTVLDTPEFFWSTPDTLQGMYRKCCDYLEMDTRVEVLNTRIGVLTDMFGMVRSSEWRWSHRRVVIVIQSNRIASHQIESNRF